MLQAVLSCQAKPQHLFVSAVQSVLYVSVWVFMVWLRWPDAQHRFHYLGGFLLNTCS